MSAKFERFQVDSACISYWDVPHPGRLGSLLATDTAKNGGWWFYSWYGAMTGNMTFHFALYEFAGSEVTLPLVETLWLQAGPFVALSARLPDMRWTLRHHARLLAALRAGDARAARRAIKDDIEESLQQLLRKASFAEGRQTERRKPRGRGRA